MDDHDQPQDGSELLHYAERQIAQIDPREYAQEIDFKPVGFWVSVGTDWLDWCTGEEFRMKSLAFTHRVELARTANLLHLQSAGDIDIFTEKYSVDAGERWRRKGGSIDWPRVARRYQGIIIMPYCYSRRMADHTSWYYPWDCASGCIWDLAAIKSIVPLPQAVTAGVE